MKPVNEDSDFLKVEIRFQWYTVGINVAIAISLGIMTCMAVSTLKYFFSNTMKSQIAQIQIIFYAFVTC